MSGWARFGLIAVFDERLHRLAVWREDSSVAGFREWGLGEPPNAVDGVFRANAADVDPLGGRWKFGWVPPIVLQGKVKTVFLAEHDQKFEVIEGACRRSGFPSSADIDDQTPVVPKNLSKTFRERSKPVTVGVSVLIPIRFFFGPSQMEAMS